jgi:N-acetylneuraminic acid mutarotase
LTKAWSRNLDKNAFTAETAQHYRGTAISKKAALLLACFLISSFIMAAKPVSDAAAVENSWTSKAPMPTARGGLGATAVNGKIYAIGGIGGEISLAIGTVPYSSGFLNTNEAYDPITNTWETKASMPTARDNFAIATYQNKIYCMGGVTGMTTVPYADTEILLPSYLWSIVNEAYDPATDTWETKAPMPSVPNVQLTANVVDGKIYLLGGLTTQPVMVYDPATDTWNDSQTEKLKDSWNKVLLDAYDYESSESVGNQFASAVYNNKIFALSYYIGLNSDKALLMYDSSGGSWNLGSPAPSGIQCGVAAITSGFIAPKRIYFLGPTCNYAYDPENDSWQIGVPMPTLRAYLSSVTVDDKLYVIGGYTSKSGFFTISSVANEVYTPFGYGAVPPLVSVVSPGNKMYNTTSVDLVFAVNKPAVWMGYSLDGQDNVTVTGNSTLNGLTNGLHKITVYANDTFGNMCSSETLAFSVAVPAPVPLVLASAGLGIAVLVVGVGLFYYVKKRLAASKGR